MAALYFKDKEIQGNLNYISVGGEPINNQEKSIEITEKGTYEVTYDEGYTGLEKVNIDVNIQGGGGGDLDFTQIGYTRTPQEMVDDFNYSKNIYDSWDSSITSRYRAFYGDIKLVYFPFVDTSNVTSMSNMFNGCTRLYSVPSLNTSKVTTMNWMFYDCQSLSSLDVSNWDTSKVTDMSYTFHRCSGLTSLDVSKWDTSNVTNMKNMFQNCSKLTSLDVTNFNTSNVTNMEAMFSDCSGLTSIDVSNFNTSKVTNMGNMFYRCSGLISLDVSNWDTSKVSTWHSSIYGMFDDCPNLRKVDGFLDYRAATTNGGGANWTFEKCSALRKFEVHNLGSINKQSNFYFMGSSNGMALWGENTDDIPDARESMINSLITYSFDRAAAGYTTTCTITMHSNAKARLTEEEIAQITSKGYTIA